MSKDARLTARAIGTLVICIAFVSPAFAASVRGPNFLVTAADPQLAQEVLQRAETYRKQLALDWLGHELPPWSAPCPIAVRVGGGAGGQTSFAFHRGVPFNWTMEIFGPRERILDSVLPHEVLHTIFATHFGQPLPRWADEGACTTVEHYSETNKNTTLLYRFLKSDRGIAFNRMFAMKEYPEDILPLYAQGYSLARFLIGQGGKQKFVQYVGEGMRTNNWTRTTLEFYGHPSLSSLQVAWLGWVRDGSDEAIIDQYAAPLLADSGAPAGAVVRGQSPSAGDPARPIATNNGNTTAVAYEANPNQLAADSIAPARGAIAPRQSGVSGGYYSQGSRAVSNAPQNGAEEPNRLAARDDSFWQPGDVLPSAPAKQSPSRGDTWAPTYYLPGGTSLYR